MNLKKLRGSLITVFCLILISGEVFASSWVKKGGAWYYYDTYETPVENQWITYNGKSYYIGGGGAMKTGWFADPETGEKVYLGSDGAKKYNSFTEDLKQFVGENGTELTLYGRWLTDAEKVLKEDIRAFKKTMTEAQSKGTQENVKNSLGEPCVAFVDLNLDGFRDIVVVNQPFGHKRVLDVELWSEEDGCFYKVTESDLNAERYSFLRYNPQDMSSWLVMSNGLNDYSFFVMHQGDMQFNFSETYNVRYNEWGDTLYYINNEKSGTSEWETLLSQATRNTGAAYPAYYSTLEEKALRSLISVYPSAEELSRWQELEDGLG